MPDGRGLRLALEAVFLVVVAGVLVAARFGAAWVVLVMLLAWLIVAALEWAAWREEPHWSSGLPPRYHVPEQPLPPRPPSVELPAFTTYPRPAPREVEAPTWIATPQMREEVLGWPAAGLDGDAPATEEPQTTVEEMPEELLAEAAASAAAVEELDVGWPVAAEPVEDPWYTQELRAEPEPEPEIEPEPEPAPEPVALEPGPEPAALEPEPAPVAAAPALQPAAAAAARAARHRIDPYAEQPGRRWRRGRGGEAEEAVVELAELPRHARLEPREPARREG